MAFTVSDLTNYVHENEDRILRASIFGAKTISMIETMVGVKSSEKLTTLTSNAQFQADSGCSYNSSGSTTFSERTMTVSKIMVQETLCPEDLEAKFLQRKVQAGSTHDQLPFEQFIVEQKVKNINKNLEMAVWQGDSSQTYNTNLKQFAGLLKQISDAGTAVDGNTSGATSITSSNAITLLQNMYNVIPADVLGADDLKCFVGWDTFRLIVTNLINNNWFHYQPGGAADAGEIVIPGLNIPVVAVHGLNASNDSALPTSKKNRMIMARTSNLYFGTDLLNEEENFDIWYSKDNQNIKLSAKFKAGTQIAFPTEIVQYTNA